MNWEASEPTATGAKVYLRLPILVRVRYNKDFVYHDSHRSASTVYHSNKDATEAIRPHPDIMQLSIARNQRGEDVTLIKS